MWNAIICVLFCFSSAEDRLQELSCLASPLPFAYFLKICYIHFSPENYGLAQQVSADAVGCLESSQGSKFLNQQRTVRGGANRVDCSLVSTKAHHCWVFQGLSARVVYSYPRRRRLQRTSASHQPGYLLQGQEGAEDWELPLLISVRAS